MNIANKLTLFRISLIPIIILVWIFPYPHFNINLGYITIDYITISYKNIIVLLIFVIGIITDYVDGHLARKYNLMTTFGKFIDPIADKLLVNVLLIIFVDSSLIPILAVILMIVRDILVDGMRLIASSNGIVVSAGLFGKIKTVSQMITIILILLSNLPFELYYIPLKDFMIWFSTFVSLGSGISYYYQLKDYIFESI